MPEGTYNLVALYGEYSKLLSITIKNAEHEHSYTENITKEATCLETGEATYTCVCGNNYTQAIPALGHDYIDGVCSRCGDTINLEAGLYDKNNNLISSWDELTGTYGMSLGNSSITSSKQLSVIIKNNSKLNTATKLVIPNTITNIPKLSFYNCTTLETIIIPDSVTTLEYQAFQNCSNLKSIKLGKGITEIQYGTFMRTGITSIGLYCSGADLEIPTTITKITNTSTYMTNGAFCGCVNLKTVTLPENITTISKGLFASCTNLEEVNISSKTTSIAATAFYDCTRLNITIPNTVTSINANSFYNVPIVYYNGTVSGSPWGAKAFKNIKNK